MLESKELNKDTSKKADSELDTRKTVKRSHLLS